MTKVRINEYFLVYKRETADLVRRTLRQKYIAGVKSGIGGEPPLARVDLLSPPQIYMFDLTFYEGQVDTPIWIYTSDDFGILNLHLRFSDEQGNLIESGDAAGWTGDPDCWFYFTTACAPSGRAVILSAVATDGLGNIGLLSEQITVHDHIGGPPRARNS